LVHADLIVSLAARYRLPAIYPFRSFAAPGGLLIYGINTRDQYVGAASYVDRILKGALPAELPVQAPSRFELIVNLKTAKALDLDAPLHLQQLADEVIE
jgi:putative tryptophan/tyrosine transport system substrate-binding protein